MSSSKFASQLSILVAGGMVGVTGSYFTKASRFASPRNEPSMAAPAEGHLQKINDALLKRLEFLEEQSMERVPTPMQQSNLLGLMPKQWLEALHPQHIYFTAIYAYWQCWEMSGTSSVFFDWMQQSGSLVDLPHMPRRFCDEWQVQYLDEDQKQNFAIHIENGRFLWDVDGTPCNIPTKVYPLPQNSSKREECVAAIVEKHVELRLKRDGCLRAAEVAVEAAMQEGVKPTPQWLKELLVPCMNEGLLLRLRDPFFKERIEALPLEQLKGNLDNRWLKEAPQELLPHLTLADVLEAIHHDQGVHMHERPVPMADELENQKGIFVVDKCGRLMAGSKVRGILHHTSFCHGQAVAIAGGITIVDGILKEVSPHSGHFEPLPQELGAFIQSLKDQGIDFRNVKLDAPILMRQRLSMHQAPS